MQMTLPDNSFKVYTFIDKLNLPVRVPTGNTVFFYSALASECKKLNNQAIAAVVKEQSGLPSDEIT